MTHPAPACQRISADVYATAVSQVQLIFRYFLDVPVIKTLCRSLWQRLSPLHNHYES